MKFECGTRVAYTLKFLRSAGLFTGPPSPTSYGPFARGSVIKNSTAIKRGKNTVRVKWDNGRITYVQSKNLIRGDEIHLKKETLK